MSGTAADLDRRMRALVLLAVLTCLALFGAYQGLHGDAGPLRDTSAPAVLSVETALDALEQSGDDADAGPAAAGDFQQHVSVANQSLAAAAADDVTGLSGQQTLQSLAGLITYYAGAVQQADAEKAGSPENLGHLHDAHSVLGNAKSSEASIIGSLTALQAAQRAEVRRQTAFSLPLWIGWSLVAVSGAALLVLLTETQVYLRRRFRRRWNRPLAAASALAAGGLAVLALFTWWTARGFRESRAVLLAGPRTAQDIQNAGRGVSRSLADTGLRAGFADLVLVWGALLVVLVLWALVPRLQEYRFVRESPLRRRGPRRTVAVVLALALTAAVTVAAVRAVGDDASVTVLATWTGSDEETFREQVAEPFEEATGIHVTYQGSSAESEVLAADSETGSPPDVAIMSAPGDLAGYARAGRLAPLDGVARAAGLDGIWNLPVDGGPAGRHTFWVPAKVDLKSLVWHPADVSAPDAARDPAEWCLGLSAGATSGWPGTDWVEDILLQGPHGPDLYGRLATGRLAWTSDAVKAAFGRWRGTVDAGSPAVAAKALTTDYTDAASDPGAASGTCSLEHQSTFVRSSGPWVSADARFTHSADALPGAARDSTAWEVSGDLAAVFHSTPESRRFLSFLMEDSTQRAWHSHDAGFSANRGIVPDDGGGATTRDIAEILRDRSRTHCWDASDALPPLVRDAFTAAVTAFLADPGHLDEQLASVQDANERAHHQADLGKVAFLPSVCDAR